MPLSLFDKVESKHVAVAVSGGPDSMALVLLVNLWAKPRGILVTALTVDHGLRSESADEAKQVAIWLSARSIEHKTLTWVGVKPKTGVEEAARDARYRLMLDYCDAHGIDTLFLGHHQSDQVETFILRLIRGSGVDGLSAMGFVTCREGVKIYRPLLNMSKLQILKILSDLNQDYFTDSMNMDSRFERVRIRTKLPILKEIGINEDMICLSAKRLARARRCLEQVTIEFIQNCVSINEKGGYAFITYDMFGKAPDEIKLRTMQFLIMLIGGKCGFLSMEKLERLILSLYKSSTLGDCQIVPVKNGFYICKELLKMASKQVIMPHIKTMWDRFEIVVDKKVWVLPLQAVLKPSSFPAKVRKTLPAFFDEYGLLAVPALDYVRKDAHIKIQIELRKQV